MNINKKIIKAALITMLITVLIGGDVLFLSQGIAEAIDDNLEAQQITTSNNRSIKFGCPKNRK